jgi:hypothetical protein
VSAEYSSIPTTVVRVTAIEPCTDLGSISAAGDRGRRFK